MRGINTARPTKQNQHVLTKFKDGLDLRWDGTREIVFPYPEVNQSRDLKNLMGDVSLELIFVNVEGVCSPRRHENDTFEDRNECTVRTILSGRYNTIHPEKVTQIAIYTY